MTKSSLRLTALAAAALSIAGDAGAQSLSQRVASAPAGPVQFSFAAREGVCGNGRTYISSGPNMFTGTFNGSVSDVVRSDPCQPGPVRVVLGRADGEVVDVNTYVGPPGTTSGATDLGTVPAREAADFLLSLATRVDGRPGRDAIFPATLADSVTLSPTLLAIAKDQARSRETRRTAISYLAREVEARGGASRSDVASALGAIARDESDNQSVRQQALSVLSRLEGGEGIPALIEISRSTTDTWLGKHATASLARSGDPRARQFLRTAVQRTDIPEETRISAIRGIGTEYATSQDAAFLRDLYGKLESDKTREAVIGSLAEMGGTENAKWLLSIARNANEPLRLRKRAVQTAEKAGASGAELIALYDGLQDSEMKSALISVYAQSGTKAATDKLLAIARTEPDYQIRRRTISYLGRSEDPRVKQALKEIVER
jgi:hypothetical protein